MKKLITIILLAAIVLPCFASDLDEFRIKREQVFEFTEKPAVTRKGDNVTIKFETKGFPDCTVAIENNEGRIVRHLASGVLGKKAPLPFQKSSKKQTIIWDGKDDLKRYIDDKDQIVVRVSLGLKPQFERTLFFFPNRRASRYPPLMAAAPEGMYVFDGGNGIDHLRLFDHKGNYVRAVYPFPAQKIDKVTGLFPHTYPQDGKSIPIKPNFLQTSMLTSGTNSYRVITYKPELKAYRSVIGVGGNAHYGREGGAGASMSIAGNRIALGHIYLNRISSNGSSFGPSISGPKVCLQLKTKGSRKRSIVREVSPRSAALSPDGKTLYLTGYIFAGAIGTASADIITNAGWDAFHAVMKLDVDKNDPMTVFAGDPKRHKHGTDAKHLTVPTSVACDAKGRVYVSDYLNDRIQVFTPDGKLVKSIKAQRPARVAVHRKTGEIFVFSWTVMTYMDKGHGKGRTRPELDRFTPMPNAKKIGTYKLKVKGLPSSFNARYGTTFMEYFAELDPWAEKPAIWMVQEWAMSNVLTRKQDNISNIVILGFKGKELTITRSFAKDLAKAGVYGKLHKDNRQRMYVHPVSGKLYLTEGQAFHGKSFKQAYVIDPDTGKFTVEQLPFDAEDMCFDLEGRAYLRNISMVGRFDSKTWREIPWDYGEERSRVCTSSSSDRKETSLVSGLPLPANGGWHHGGMYASPAGSLLVVCNYMIKPLKEKVKTTNDNTSKAYLPVIYPGRAVGGRGGGPFFHVWDKHGKLVHMDAVKGVADNSYGVGLDKQNNIYLMAAATRILDGKKYFNDMTGTLMKFKPGKGKIISKSAGLTKLSKENHPQGPPDIVNAAQGESWVTGAEWMYGGVGWMGKNMGIGCACPNCRFAFDYFHRSFAPEIDRYTVAVLDSSGNLILRLGQYGNVDDGKPMRNAERGTRSAGPPNPKSIGGDEIALFHGAYLATHSDKRLFIADPGNGRILSVKLNYHTDERIRLAEIKNK